jgi:hypothetical protein
MEVAGKIINREVTRECWETLASIEQIDFEWRPRLLQKIPSDNTSKEKLKELLQMKRYLAVVPAAWCPQIMSVTPSSLQLCPFITESFHGASGNPEAASLGMPSLVTVPLALGINPGEKLAVGLHIETHRGHATEGVLLGVEFTGMHDGWGKYMSVLCAPFTGKCKMKFQGNEGDSVEFQAMQPLADDHCGSVDVYVTIAESGDMEFLRFCKATDSLVRSGKMPRNMMPSWATEIFASVNVQMEYVTSGTRISTKWAAKSLPRYLQSQLEQRSLRDFIFEGPYLMQSSHCLGPT